MNDFFHGWRRKLGCITLVMACAFCTLWVRSLRTADTVVVALAGTSLEGRSQRGSLDLMIHWVFNKKPDEFGIGASKWHSEKLPLMDPNDSGYRIYFLEDIGPDWRYQQMSESSGFRYSSGELFDTSGKGRVETKLIGFPHWFVAIPLTLMSAWLILVKLRQRIAMVRQTETPHA